MRLNNFSGVIWVTGLPGAGKSTFSKQVKASLLSQSIQVILLDGDELRVIMANDDYQESNRNKLAFSYAKLCHNLAQQNNLVICATVSMFDDVRLWNRQNNENYCEVYLSVSNAVLNQRDQKGLYSLAATGKNVMLPGTSQAVQLPKQADFMFIDMPHDDIKIQAKKVINKVLSWM